MSRFIGELNHPVNGTTVPIYSGFSWPCFLFGSFWYLYKGMWVWAIISFAAACFTCCISWLIFPFFANNQHKDFLFKQGYLEKSNTVKCPFCAEIIKAEANVCRYCGRDLPKKESAN
jgi:hypothetical protein